jgi:hypothetical protein
MRFASLDETKHIPIIREAGPSELSAMRYTVVLNVIDVKNVVVATLCAHVAEKESNLHDSGPDSVSHPLGLLRSHRRIFSATRLLILVPTNRLAALAPCLIPVLALGSVDVELAQRLVEPATSTRLHLILIQVTGGNQAAARREVLRLRSEAAASAILQTYSGSCRNAARPSLTRASTAAYGPGSFSGVITDAATMSVSVTTEKPVTKGTRESACHRLLSALAIASVGGRQPLPHPAA